MSIEQMRKDYTLSGLSENEVHSDPIVQFHKWFDQAKAEDIPSWHEVNAMTLSTTGADLRVSSRIVLLKGIDEQGRFQFFTNYLSHKAEQIAENSSVALCFFWPHLERQVRICGTAEKTSRETSIQYFRSRPRGSQFGAFVSDQSTLLPSRRELERLLREAEATYANQDVPCPEHWGGYAVTPVEIEFWQGRESRLHDRLVYHRVSDRWTLSRLAP